MEEVRKTPSPQPERPKSSLEVVLEAMTSLQSNMHSLHSTTRELVSRLERLERPQSHKFVVDASSNPGQGSATGLVDAPDHSTVGLEERGLERTKEYFEEVPMASLRRSERLAHKAAVAYNEIDSESRWQLKTLMDSNLPCTLSHVDFPSQMHPRLHADPYVHESMHGVTIGTRSGVTFDPKEKHEGKVMVRFDPSEEDEERLGDLLVIGRGYERRSPCDVRTQREFKETDMASDRDSSRDEEIRGIMQPGADRGIFHKENLQTSRPLEYTNLGLTKSDPDRANQGPCPGEGAHMADPHLGHRSPGTTMVHSFSEPRASYRVYDRDQHSGADQQSVVDTRVTFNANEIATRTSMNFVTTSPFRPMPVYISSVANSASARPCLFPQFPVYGPGLGHDPCASSAAWWMPVPAPVSHGFGERLDEWAISNGAIQQTGGLGAQKIGWSRESAKRQVQSERLSDEDGRLGDTRSSEMTVLQTETSRQNKTVARRLSEVPMTSVATQTVVDASGLSQTDAVTTKEVANPRSASKDEARRTVSSVGCSHKPKQWIKLPTYNGKSDVETFLCKFSICAKNNE